MQCGLDLARSELSVDTLDLKARHLSEFDNRLESATRISASTDAVHAVIRHGEFHQRLQAFE